MSTNLVNLGPSIRVYDTDHSTPAGKMIYFRFEDYWLDFKFQYFFRRVGNKVYYMYIPMPHGQLLKHFIRDLCENEGISLDELKELPGLEDLPPGDPAVD